jgi:hypothetical protein
LIFEIDFLGESLVSLLCRMLCEYLLFSLARGMDPHAAGDLMIQHCWFLKFQDFQLSFLSFSDFQHEAASLA